jgi:triacylglycerol lipase
MTDWRHLVDPELRPALGILRPLERTGPATLAALRSAFAAAGKAQVEAEPMDGVVMQEALAPASATPVRVVIYRPETSDGPLPAVLHLHGGGLVMGSPEMRHAELAAIARDVSCIVCSVDYRLAPENPYPAAIDDAAAALDWLAASADELQVDRARIALAGESAGGGLAAALALRVRDAGGPSLVAQLLTYPMLDDLTVTETGASPLGAFVWGAAANRFGWSSYLGGGEAPPIHAAPARAADVSNLPQTFIGVGALDLFLEEDLTYAARLAAAGVPVEAHVYPGAYHGFDGVPDAAVAAEFRAHCRRFLRRVFAR